MVKNWLNLKIHFKGSETVEPLPYQQKNSNIFVLPTLEKSLKMANKYLVRNVLQLHENIYKIPNSFFFHLNLQIDRGKSHMLYVVQKQQQQCSGGRSSQFCSTLVEAICSCSSRVAHVVWCVSDQCALYALTDGRPLCLLACCCEPQKSILVVVHYYSVSAGAWLR